MENEVVTRLRRALAESTDDPDISEIALRLMQSVFDALPDDKALIFERILGCYVIAAEQLGPDASAQEVVDRARLVAKRPH